MAVAPTAQRCAEQTHAPPPLSMSLPQTTGPHPCDSTTRHHKNRGPKGTEHGAVAWRQGRACGEEDGGGIP